MEKKYIAEMWAEGDEMPGDCLPVFFDSVEEAAFNAMLEIARVAEMSPEERNHTFDWAVAYSIRETTVGEDNDPPEFMAVGRTVPTREQLDNVRATARGTMADGSVSSGSRQP